MTRRFITVGFAALLAAGGVGTGWGLIPRAGTPVAFAAPVPKEVNRRIVWSEPVALKETDTLRSTCGVWLPDGSAVLVPAPTKSDDGKKTAAGGVEIRDAATGKVTGRYAPGIDDGEAFQTVAVAVSADGAGVTAGGAVFDKDGKRKEEKLFIWKAGEEKAEQAKDIGFPISAVGVSPDGRSVTVTEAANAIVHLDVKTGQPLASLRIFKKTYQTGVYHPGGKYVLTANDSGYVVASEAILGKMIGQLNFDAKFHAVAVSADGTRIAAGGAPGKAKQSLAVIDGASEKSIGEGFRTFTDAVPEKEAINGLAFSPDGKHLAAACSDGFVRVFEVEKGTLAVSAKEHTEAVYSVAYSADGSKLLTVGKDAIKVWDVGALLKAK